MSDRYIDPFETLAYGPFAADQFEALVVPIDPDYKKPLQHIVTRLHASTDAMTAAIKAAGDVEIVTYKQAPSDPSPPPATPSVAPSSTPSLAPLAAYFPPSLPPRARTHGTSSNTPPSGSSLTLRLVAHRQSLAFA